MQFLLRFHLHLWYNTSWILYSYISSGSTILVFIDIRILNPFIGTSFIRLSCVQKIQNYWPLQPIYSNKISPRLWCVWSWEWFWRKVFQSVCVLSVVPVLIGKVWWRVSGNTLACDFSVILNWLSHYSLVISQKWYI